MLNIYFTFLNLTRALEKVPGYPRLEAGEARLLEILAVAWHDGAALTISEAMLEEAVGAPATIYRKLRKLQDAGLVDMVELDTDRRVKFALPSAGALRYFERIAHCMAKAREG